MRRAARHGDGWLLAWLGPPEDVAARLDGMRRLRAEYASDARPFEVSGSGRMADPLHVLRAYRDAGLDRVIVDCAGSRSAEQAIEAIHEFREAKLARL
jgi:alkanesulfonate monooxygenase SsuD/methylene tetrahydromethanopterin reductase-like flavin-dependent oxidoreductase (luciferase family)